MSTTFMNKIIPVGSIIHSMLTVAQFQQEAGTEWVLADGTTASGTRYNTITGNANLPDFRGTYLRGKNNSRSDGKEDPAGEQALGTYESDRNLSHYHFTVTNESNADTTLSGQKSIGRADNTPTYALKYLSSDANNAADIGGTSLEGGADSRPRSYVVNIFIKVN